MLKKLKCHICDFDGDMNNVNANLQKIGNIKEIGDRNIFKCPKCKFEFIYPCLSINEKSDIYDSSGYSAYVEENKEFVYIKKLKFKKVVNICKKYKSSGNLLDVGCGTGYLMEIANSLGFDSYGLELSKFAADFISEHYGEDRICRGIIENCSWNNMFDIIVMNDFLEHVEDPINTLNAAKKLLKKDVDSYIIITTVNTDSIVCKLMKSEWPQYRLDHLSYFNRKTINEIVKKTNLDLMLYKPFFKTLTFRYVNFILKKDFDGINNHIFNILEKIPILGNMKLPLYSGEILVVLKNKK
ncbi:methyltransferase domain-containing protein [Brachyspira hyodysenteriae]|uniref:class I SAM-dependent methyltransferase n=1 Tax=Brachyspira hyodysenteriae TaxID=159 RepID=UPI001ADDDD41|nr:class I SAM-dependent methyltransferase [Brachyspira hyodysenteriae]QTM08673.1 methyltransferase domain-containing protein [Brachyspira hyodysenteriae]